MTRVITGYVYGVDGSALEGATVVAASFEVAGNVLSTAATSRTDEDGRFELELPDNTYQLSASREGYGAASAAAHSGEIVSLVLPKSGIIEGRVQDERGQPVARFSIDVISAVTADTPATPTPLSKRFESHDGSFRVEQLPSWEIVVRATAEGFAPAFSEPFTVNAAESVEVTLTLAKGCLIAGRVVDATGAPLPGVFVDAEALLVAGEMSEVSLEAAAQATSESDGSFILGGVPKGTVVLRGYDGLNAVSSIHLQIAECDRVQPVTLVMAPGGGVAGVARAPDGSPLGGVRLTLLHRAIGFVNTTSDDDGRFRFDQIPAGPIRLMMQRGEQVVVSGIVIQEGKTIDADIRLPRQGRGELRGRVVAGGKPLSSVRLMVASSTADGGVEIHYPMTAEDGNYRVSSLPPGPYLVSVVSTSIGRGTRLRPGEVTTLDLEVDPSATSTAGDAHDASPM
ncbi:carboxypeptidase-like regulatory domain-containing protein [Sorangium sp. So ce726]|uniref:carboxypeptidase regulatory-like domain-containing protein n=1 Tax=Sorangium sp. So ce726 TaxID=3133319 RepID=UPI003F5E6F51